MAMPLKAMFFRKTSFNAQVGSLGQSFMRMDNGIPLQPFHLALISRKFDTIDNALAFARIEAKEHGFAPYGTEPIIQNQSRSAVVQKSIGTRMR